MSKYVNYVNYIDPSFKVRKRDGRIVEFDPKRIQNAISQAFDSVDVYDSNFDISDIVNTAISDVLDYNKNKEIVEVENIQDIIENTLMENGYNLVAKSYILYRNNRSNVREMQSSLMKAFKEITYSDASDSDIKRENANIDGSTSMGAMLKFGSEGSKAFYQKYMMKPDHAIAHKNGWIHVHDMDFAPMGTTTCTQIDMKSLFKNGFHTGHGFLREPNSIMTYSALACIAIQSNQNDQHGGQAIVNFDYTMADGVKKSFATHFNKAILNVIEMARIENSDDNSVVFDDYINDIKYTFNNRDKSNLHNIRYFVDVSEGKEDYYGLDLYDILSEIFSTLKRYKDCTEDEMNKLILNKLKFVLSYAYSETERETYQAMEAFIHNLNTMHSRAGAQVPFSSINYGMDTSSEGRMVMINLLLATEKGLGNGETPIFPIQIFRVKEGVNYNPSDPNYDIFKLAIRCSCKRLFPNFSFIDAPFNLQYYKPEDTRTQVAYMGCRTRVLGNVYDPSREISDGRGNLSFTSINLPRLGIEAHGDIDKFFNDLEHYVNLVMDQLYDRYCYQKKKKVKNFPFLMGQHTWIDSDKLDWDDEIGDVLNHGSLSVGFIGLAECLKALIGKHHGESAEAQELGLKIIGKIREMTDARAEETKLNFSVLATPAEGLSGRFVNIDKKIYGEIEGITDRDYYTNSFHVPVYYPISAYEKIKIEAPYHNLTNAGHITYIEMDGDPTENTAAFENVIRCMKESGIGYGSVNHPIDRDPVCGYSGIINDTCPKCGRSDADSNIKFERIRRITGYLVGTLDRFNNAKKAEVNDRVKHGTDSKNKL